TARASTPTLGSKPAASGSRPARAGGRDRASGPAPRGVEFRVFSSHFGRLRNPVPSPERPALHVLAASSVHRLRTFLLEQDHAGSIAMEEVLPADGAELAHREEARDGDRAEDVADEPDVVVGLAEEARAATVAGEEEAPLHARRRPLGAL